VVREIEEFFVRATAEALTAGARSVSAAVA
jgi:hypothetical protein